MSGREYTLICPSLSSVVKHISPVEWNYYYYYYFRYERLFSEFNRRSPIGTIWYNQKMNL